MATKLLNNQTISGRNLLNRIKKDIDKFKSRLIKEAEAKGLSENFGDKEIRTLRNKYPHYSLINEVDSETAFIAYNLVKRFEDWCYNYSI